MTLEELKREIRSLVDSGEIDEDILVLLPDISSEEELEDVLENYT